MNDQDSERIRCERLAARLNAANPEILFHVDSTDTDEGDLAYFVLAECFIEPPPAIAEVPAGWLVFYWYRDEYNCVNEIVDARLFKEDDDE